MRPLVLWLSIAALLAAGCAETVRCPDGQFFGTDGACVPIPDAGQRRTDAATDAAGDAARDGG